MAINDKDKLVVEKICVDCGSTIYTKHGWARRQPKDYAWRCKSCMSKHRSEIQKNSPTNITNIIKAKLDDPDEAKKYKKMLSDRAIEQWENKTEQEKKMHIQHMVKCLQEFYKTASPSIFEEKIKRLKDYFANRNEEEIARVSAIISTGRKNFFKNMDDKDWEEYCKLYKESYENKSPEEKEAHAQRTRDQFTNMTPEQYEEWYKHNQEAQQARWDNADEEYRKKHGEKVKNSIAKRSDEEKERIRKIHQDRWAKMKPEEKYNKLKETFSKSNHDNKFNKKFEDMFNHSYLVNDFYILPEILTINNSFDKSWDYGIYSKSTNELVMVVDLDGAYYHADVVDYDGIHSHEELDERRSFTIPYGIKSHIIYEKNIKDSFQSMIKVLKLNYEEFIDNIFQYCRSISFPYPKYTNDELKRSWRYLIRMNCDKKHFNISTNSRLGDRIITHFHPSIYHACVGKNPSPYDAWYNPDLLRKCIENRIIYQINITPNKILQGFNVSKIAPKVSVFSAGRAKLLIHKYLYDVTEIFDPFAGFGGRMLGAASLNKKYIGQDISDNHIHENLEIVNFLNLDELVSLECKDILDSSGEYECLFTCPPYEDKEFWKNVNSSINSCDDWVDICLKRFKCKKYLFVIDDTVKYKEYIVGEIVNKSHFNNNSEKVILITREE